MVLSPGTRLGSYEIVALVGEGGMGQVREAQVLASLNHPNIAHIYGLEDATSVRALVMELVEGPTLADVIARGICAHSIDRVRRLRSKSPSSIAGVYLAQVGGCRMN